MIAFYAPARGPPPASNRTSPETEERKVPKNKVVPIDEAMAHVKSGMSIAVGGFIGQGDPLTLIDYLKTMDVRDLTIYENDAGYRDRGTVELVNQGKVKKIVASHVGTTPEIGKAMNEGRLEVEATPQGTLAEMLRCGGAGLGGFLTPTGIGTIAEEGKQIIELGGRTYILVPSVKCDVAIVRAHRGDTWGNLIYRGTSRNFNVPAAMCADYVIAEVENLYTMGELDPEAIHTSGHLRRRRGARRHQLLHRSREAARGRGGGQVTWQATPRRSSRARAGRELKDGQIINLGIGLPTLIANYVPEGVDVVIQTENGGIGVGPAPAPGCEDRDRANAGNQPITLIPGGSYFDSATSFAMIRGGHVDSTFLGTLQVDEEGNIANWIVPGKPAGRHGRGDGPGHGRQDRPHRHRALRQRRQPPSS